MTREHTPRPGVTWGEARRAMTGIEIAIGPDTPAAPAPPRPNRAQRRAAARAQKKATQ